MKQQAVRRAHRTRPPKGTNHSVPHTVSESSTPEAPEVIAHVAIITARPPSHPTPLLPPPCMQCPSPKLARHRRSSHAAATSRHNGKHRTQLSADEAALMASLQRLDKKLQQATKSTASKPRSTSVHEAPTSGSVASQRSTSVGRSRSNGRAPARSASVPRATAAAGATAAAATGSNARPSHLPKRAPRSHSTYSSNATAATAAAAATGPSSGSVRTGGVLSSHRRAGYGAAIDSGGIRSQRTRGGGGVGRSNRAAATSDARYCCCCVAVGGLALNVSQLTHGVVMVCGSETHGGTVHIANSAIAKQLLSGL